MKKLFITIAFVAATMFASAQFFVGGNLGFGTTGGSRKVETSGTTTTTDQPKGMNFTIAPQVGYMFAENMGVGLDLGYTFSKETTITPATDIDPESKEIEKANEFGFKPYFRYVIPMDLGKFSVYCDAYFEWSTRKPKTTVEQGSTTTTTEGNKVNKWGLGIQPGMAYMLTDNISMNCTLNILTIAFHQTKTIREAENSKTTTKNNSFGIGINEPTAIKIGFFYTF